MRRASATADFYKGVRIEVLKKEEDAVSIWFPAVVLRLFLTKPKRNTMYVEFETLRVPGEDAKPLREYVEVVDVRPEPPHEVHRYFEVGDVVEALYGEKKGWRKGRVLEILENSKYAVLFSDDTNGGSKRVLEEVVEQWALRIYRVWDDGSWEPPIQLPKISTETELKTEELKGKKCSATMLEQFNKGMSVEVKRAEKHHEGAWYMAVILGHSGNNSFLVEFQTVTTEDGFEMLKKTVLASDIRPYPPPNQQTKRFKMFDEVDAWHNEGWQVGIISKVLRSGSKYKVHFWTTNEEHEFYHHDVRPHQEWIRGKWITGFKKRPKLQLKSKLTKLKKGNGPATSGACSTHGAKHRGKKQ